MRAWTIVLFILALHACTAMFTHTNILDIGLNVSLDTSSSNIIQLGPSTPINIANDESFFNSSANSSTEIRGTNSSAIGKTDFVGKMIEAILGVADTFIEFMATFSKAIFSIQYMCAPYFGYYNAWILEAIVDTVFGVSLFQMVTGRSFKTMD